MIQTSRESVEGRATGTFFFTGFGTLWIATGLSAMHRLTVSTLVLVLCVGAVLLLAGFALMRRARDLPSLQGDPAEWRRVQRVFNAVNIIQWVAVAVAVAVLVMLQLPFYIVPAIAIIVGLHLYPLAGAFRYPMHYVTGTVLIAWSVACIALLDRARLPGIGAFGTGCILLLSSTVTLTLAFSAARSSAASALASQI